VGSLAISWALFSFVEKPLIALGKRGSKRSAPAQAQVAAGGLASVPLSEPASGRDLH